MGDGNQALKRLAIVGAVHPGLKRIPEGTGIEPKAASKVGILLCGERRDRSEKRAPDIMARRDF